MDEAAKTKRIRGPEFLEKYFSGNVLGELNVETPHSSVDELLQIMSKTISQLFKNANVPVSELAQIVIGIPARMGSTRFPGKPLCDILGKSMLEHCYRRCSLSKHATELFVAACDTEIESATKSFGGNVIMTERSISRPGLRVAAAAQTLELEDDDIVLRIVISVISPPVAGENDVILILLSVFKASSKPGYKDKNSLRFLSFLKRLAANKDLSFIASTFDGTKLPNPSEQSEPKI